jgi:hypothetical protein
VDDVQGRWNEVRKWGGGKVRRGKRKANEEKKRSQLILKPSQMFSENSVSSSGLDSTESSLRLRRRMRKRRREIC